MGNNSVSRIALWSGPRNISTALMYSFANRPDTKVFDEPLYAFYLKNRKNETLHPGENDILNSMEQDGDSVVDAMLNCSEKPVLFFKNMTHHILDLNRNFMCDCFNVILTRDPKEMLPSFDKVIENATLDDVGYKLHVELVDEFDKKGIKYVVLDAKNVLLNPESIIKQLCDAAKIPFFKTMLSWKPSKRKEDGVWAEYWYNAVHKSSGFKKHEPKIEKFPEHLKPLLEECQPYYNRLKELALL